MSGEGDSVLQQLQQRLEAGKGYLLAVSGGVDSVVLLHACLRMRETLDVHFEVAHIDHGLRPESADDATFVRQLAESNAVPYHELKAPPPDAQHGIEAWGREVRYSFLQETRVSRKLDFLLTAHHANDQAETVLMRFLANREPTSIHAVDLVRSIARPLLDLRRVDLVDYARKYRLEFREDSSNQNQAFLRNRYRHSIMPFLERELEADLVKVLSERAVSLEDDASALEQLARDALVTIKSEKTGSRDWLRNLRALNGSLPRAISWRVVERILAEQYGDYFGRRTCLRVLAFIDSGEAAIEIPGGHRIRRSGGGLEFL